MHTASSTGPANSTVLSTLSIQLSNSLRIGLGLACFLRDYFHAILRLENLGYISVAALLSIQASFPSEWRGSARASFGADFEANSEHDQCRSRSAR